ncbi:metal-dependent hydrolase family protein [Oceaniglobus trochenteri]|uniref:metal-dependent hydrolase family protein n=1 Tax=Oceaniglobus trochenteri TaxID=2763260 RepID=UPI001CFFE418|nr:amidohydrolase family protein [Oceaniglobus trochenteri]
MTQKVYALTDAHIVDVVGGEILTGRAVVVSNGRIKAIVPEGELDGDIARVSLDGRYLSPGLLDCHAHCFIGQFNDGKSVLPSELTARAGNHLHGMLMRGFTTVRDAGGADQGHRSALEKGEFSGPRLFVSGRILSQTGGHGDHRGRADTCHCSSDLGGISIIADGVDEVRKAVRENARQGVDQIKIMAGGGVSSPGDKLIHPQYSMEELYAIVDETERCGRYVLSHVYSDIGIHRAVTAGVRSIEHGNFLSDKSAALMAEKGAHLVPTLITYQADGRYGKSFGWSDENAEKNDEVLESGLESLKVAQKAGVNIGYGTDLCWSPKRYQGDGLQIHQEVCGPAEALRHATINNAKVVRMEGLVGQIAEGAHADLLVVDANPLEDLSCFGQHDNKVVTVIQAGRAVRDDVGVMNAVSQS